MVYNNVWGFVALLVAWDISALEEIAIGKLYRYSLKRRRSYGCLQNPFSTQYKPYYNMWMAMQNEGDEEKRRVILLH
jgi:hypothetical protein